MPPRAKSYWNLADGDGLRVSGRVPRVAQTSAWCMVHKLGVLSSRERSGAGKTGCFEASGVCTSAPRFGHGQEMVDKTGCSLRTAASRVWA
jgi:hypothetical protein